MSTGQLEHFGVLGMKWGRRKGPQAVAVKATPGRRVSAKGGKRQSASEDAISAAVAKQKARKSTTDSLSTKELQNLVTRMNLEQQYSKLSGQSAKVAAGKQIVSLLLNVGKEVLASKAKSGK
jgi:hypothetical protein